ncbi:MAG: LacI family DNA-binding transcriptional regulator [Inquilinus sp.]|nr:LacI family DNA-binding transcriptional regulator [Inquilinus sp.]
MEDSNRRRRASRHTVTIQDIADRAGVSTATVSRTLANPEFVSVKSRVRVLRAVTETGYTPNVAARNLRARRSMKILVVVPNLANPFFAEVLRGIDDELAGAGYDMIIGNLDNLAEREARYVKLAMSGQVDGVLNLTGRVPKGDGRSMAELGLPMAGICAIVPGQNSPHVVVNDRAVSVSVAEHLLGLGHRRFGYISGPAGNINEIERHAGFLDGLRAAGIDGKAVVRWPGAFNLGSGIAAARDFLRRGDRPTAVYAASDEMAIAFMKTLLTAGLEVPGDVSIVGFDGIEFAELVEPTLTTVRQPRHNLGRMGARALLDEIAGTGSGARIIEMPATLIVGDSTAPPRAERPSRAPAKTAVPSEATGGEKRR